MRHGPPPRPLSIPETARDPLPGPGNGVRVWLVRHGAVDPERADEAYGSDEVELSSLGARQTGSLSIAFREVPVGRVVMSPIRRALAMGLAIATETGAERAIDPRLGELDRGDWQGLPWSEYRVRWDAEAAEFWADPWDWAGHGGESERALFERVWPAFEDAAGRGGTVVLATHRNVIRSIATAALGLPVSGGYALRNDPGRATLVVDTPLGWCLERSNVLVPGRQPADGPA